MFPIDRVKAKSIPVDPQIRESFKNLKKLIIGSSAIIIGGHTFRDPEVLADVLLDWSKEMPRADFLRMIEEAHAETVECEFDKELIDAQDEALAEVYEAIDQTINEYSCLVKRKPKGKGSLGNS